MSQVLHLSWVKNIRQKRKERKEERNWRESLEVHISAAIENNIHLFYEEIRIENITNEMITYKKRCYYPQESWRNSGLYSAKVDLLPEYVQKEIMKYIRYQKLKRINKL